MRYLIGLVILATACGGSDGGDPAEAVTCEKTDRSGTYWAEFETLSGTCPDQSAGLIRLDADAGAACVLASPETWSDAECTLETEFSCPFDELEPGATVRTVAITTQQDSAGDEIVGTMTMTVLGSDGAIVCSGSFRMTAARQ